jgi:hypothetical protein
MKIRLAFIELLHCNTRMDLVILTGAFLQFVVRKAPKTIGSQEEDA